MSIRIYKQGNTYFATNGNIQVETTQIKSKGTGFELPLFTFNEDLISLFPWLKTTVRDYIYKNHLAYKVSKFVQDECWLSTTAKATTGYRMLYMSNQNWGFGISRYAHIASHLVFNGDIPKGKIVRHKCDVKPCCNPDHLEVGTQQDNLEDATKRYIFSVPLNRAWKINTREVCLIRFLSSNGIVDNKTLSHIFGIHNSAIQRIATKKSYSEVDCSWFYEQLNPKNLPYSDAELKLISDPNYTPEEVSIITNRSIKSIGIKRRKIGVFLKRCFTPEEDKIILDNAYNNIRTYETAKKLNRSANAINRRRRYLRMKGKIR